VSAHLLPICKGEPAGSPQRLPQRQQKKYQIKMKYNPHIHHRRSIRLKGYDYSQAGLYFITICTQNRACLFGEIRRGEPTCSPEIILNDTGMMIKKWYCELENKYPDKQCHEMVIMPNHFHCIIENIYNETGAPYTVPTTKNTMPPLAMQWVGFKQ